MFRMKTFCWSTAFVLSLLVFTKVDPIPTIELGAIEGVIDRMIEMESEEITPNDVESVVTPPDAIAENERQMEIEDVNDDTRTAVENSNVDVEDPMGGNTGMITTRHTVDSNCGCTKWTGWLDRDNPSGTGDWENVYSFRVRGTNICDGMRPLAAECKVVGTSTVFNQYTTSLSPNKLYVGCTPEGGLVCKGTDQTSGVSCRDFQIRFRCPVCECTSWGTVWKDRDNPSGTGDWELISNSNVACYRTTPVQAECYASGNVFEYWNLGGLTDSLREKCTPRKGLSCVNAEQTPAHTCADYKIKQRCFHTSKTYWTTWLDRDNPSGTGDWELLHSFIITNNKNICNGMTPLAAQCRVGSTGTIFDQYTATSVAQDKLFVPCTPEAGLVCKKSDQSDNTCSDYKIRFRCPCQ